MIDSRELIQYYINHEPHIKRIYKFIQRDNGIDNLDIYQLYMLLKCLCGNTLSLTWSYAETGVVSNVMSCVLTDYNISLEKDEKNNLEDIKKALPLIRALRNQVKSGKFRK